MIFLIASKPEPGTARSGHWTDEMNEVNGGGKRLRVTELWKVSWCWDWPEKKGIK